MGQVNMGQVKKVYLVEDDSVIAMNTRDTLIRLGYTVEYFSGFPGLKTEYDKDIEEGNLIYFITDMNIPVSGANFTKAEIEESDFGKYAGWMWSYKNIVKPIEEGTHINAECNKCIIVYSAFIESLSKKYFETRVSEHALFKKYVKPVHKNESINSIEKLLKALEEVYDD